jgi:hypothetical protein
MMAWLGSDFSSPPTKTRTNKYDDVALALDLSRPPTHTITDKYDDGVALA